MDKQWHTGKLGISLESMTIIMLCYFTSRSDH